MEFTLEADAFSADDVESPPEGGPRLCACGCGEPLREGAKHRYLRGHKAAAERDKITPDPEPGDEAKKRTIRATARVRTEMRETLEAYFAMAAGAWSLSDPLCGTAVLDASPQIAEKLVPILARNQAFIRYFQTSNSFREGMDLFLVVLPVLRVIAAHHIFHTVGQPNLPDGVVDYNEYAA